MRISACYRKLDEKKIAPFKSIILKRNLKISAVRHLLSKVLGV